MIKEKLRNPIMSHARLERSPPGCKRGKKELLKADVHRTPGGLLLP
jgi:hypothetical protein